jgi:outer membrane protein OmpA-like peptidoglycan-associated protein
MPGHFSAAMLLGCWAALGLTAAPAQQDGAVISGSQIEQALTPPHTRGLTLRATSDPTAVTTARATAEAPPSIDLDIPFALNSSELQPQAAAQLEQLRAALSSQSLLKDRFVIAGHTDATGSVTYNRTLSQRRAETVKGFLVAGGVPAERLQTIGYGAERLLTPDRPADARNRRVEIKNLGAVP